MSFVGSINDKLRKFFSTYARLLDGRRCYIGCSGNFTIEQIITRHCPTAEIHSNDVSLYSSAIGHMLTGKPFPLQVTNAELLWANNYMQRGPTESVAVILLLLELLKYEKRKNPYAERMWQAYLTGIDKEGNYGCSCPVWKFKRQECHHIVLIKDRPQDAQEIKYLEAMPGSVGEVTIKGDKVLYPLVPFGGIQVHLAATIIYDMQRANVNPGYIRDYKDRILKNASFKALTDYIIEHGRLVYTEWVKGSGWTKPVAVHHDTPLKQFRR